MKQNEKDQLLSWIRWHSFRPDTWVNDCVDVRNLRQYIRDEM